MAKAAMKESKLREIRYGMAGAGLDCLTFVFGAKKEISGPVSNLHITRTVRSPPADTYSEEPSEVCIIDPFLYIHQLTMGLFFWDNYK